MVMYHASKSPTAAVQMEKVDGPSRLAFEEVEKMGCKRIHISKKWLARALNVVH